jgi:TonB family protein
MSRSKAFIAIAVSMLNASFVHAQGGSAPPRAATEEAELPVITKMPKLIEFVQATYPEQASAEGIEAVVILDIDINAAGNVEAVSVAQSAEPAGHGFDAAAAEAVRKFRFEPAEAGGQPIPVRVSYKYGFELAEQPALEPASEVGPPKVLSFEGKLVERGTGKALPGLRVTVFREEGEETAGFESFSDAEGHFEFFNLAAGAWKVLVEAEGYYPVRTTEQIHAGETLDAEYYVERESYNPFDVLVEARRVKKEVNRRTLATEEIEKVPGTFGDPLTVVTNLPSVARQTFGDGTLVVRGAAPEDSEIMIDGIAVPLAYHFFSLRSVVPAGMLENIDFYPGNFSSYYGRATEGVVDVKVKRLQPDSIGGYADVSLLDAGVYLEAPLGQKGALAIAGRRSHIDFVLDATIPHDSPVSFKTAPRYYDGQILFNYRPTERQEIRAFAFGSDDALKLLFNSPADLNTELRTGSLSNATRFWRGVIEHDWTPNEQLRNELKLSIGHDQYKQTVGERYFVDFDFWAFNARETARWKLSHSMQWNLGIDYLAEVRSWSARMPPPAKEGSIASEAVNYDDIRETGSDGVVIHRPAAFLEAEWKPLQGLLVVPGLRVDRFGAIGQITVDPRLTARYAGNDWLTLKGGVGIFHRAPLLDEVDEEFGNPDIEAERAIHYSIGAEAKVTRALTVDATGFYKTLDHLVSATDATIERDGRVVPERFNNEGEGRVYGLDLMVRHEFAHNFFGWVSYTLSRSERRGNGATDYRLFDTDQTHILTVLGTYRLPHNWEVGARWRLVSGNPTTPVEGGVFDSDADRYRPSVGAINSSRLPAFHQLDVRVDKRWIYDGWILNAYLDVQNAYNKKNSEEIAHNYDFSKKKQASGLPILTIVGLRAEF